MRLEILESMKPCRDNYQTTMIHYPTLAAPAGRLLAPEVLNNLFQ
jgi:hypothetical protein